MATETTTKRLNKQRVCIHRKG